MNADDRIPGGGGKQVDPVNFARLGDDWRVRLKDCVGRRIELGATYDALAVNGVEFIHVDFNDHKRVLVWRRGQAGSDKQVAVLANFSDFETADPFNARSEYFVPNRPATPPGKQGIENVTEAGRRRRR